MPHIVADRVRETSTTTGTGNISLAGAVTGFRAFSAVCANNDTVFYAVALGAEWETGRGTWLTGNSLARTSVIASSNAGALVNFSAGTKEVFLTIPGTNYIPIWEAASPGTPPARMAYLYASDQNGRTVLEYNTPGGNTIRLGRDSLVVVRNTSGVTVNPGECVYITGSTGTTPNVSKYIADGTIIEGRPLGLSVETINNNSFGFILQTGRINSLNTAGFTEGDRVYASASSAGALTATAPSHPNLRVVIGVVANAHASAGAIIVQPISVRGDHVGTHNNDWSVGNGSAGAKSVRFVAAGANIGTLQQTPTAARTVTIPDLTGTLRMQEGAQVRNGVLIVSPAGPIADYNPSGLADAYELRFTPSVSLIFSGLAGGVSGREILVRNAQSSDFLIIMNNEDPSSAAANRFVFDEPLFLMPGDSVVIRYNATTSRWNRAGLFGRLLTKDVAPFTSMLLVDDFAQGLATTGNVGATGWGLTVSGTGAAVTNVTTGSDATQKALGVIQAALGTVATNRVGIHAAQAAGVVPALGPLVMMSRVASTQLSTSVEEFRLSTGLHDGAAAAGEAVDGVYWEYDRATGGDFWRTVTASNSVRTKNTTNFVPVATRFQWLGIFINAAWTRADFYHSENADVWAFSNTGPHTVDVPNTAARATQICPMKAEKTVGITSRNTLLDATLFCYNYRRGI